LAGAEAELLKLAHAARIPVMTSSKGKGVFPENDPLSLGVLGFGGHERAANYLKSSAIDLLMVIGSSLNEFVTISKFGAHGHSSSTWGWRQWARPWPA